MSIIFEQKNIEYAHPNTSILVQWIKNTISSERKRAGDIAIVFTSDSHLLDINRQYLEHDYYTDIITFDYTEDSIISGDLLISIDTVKDNAKTYEVDFLMELHRVIIHGVLHLCGYHDKTKEEQKEMRHKEDFYLTRLPL